MGLQLDVSNSLFQLVDHLCDDLGKPLKSVFQPHYIVTQTPGMNNWLKIQIAERLGITANCRFLKPNDIVTQLYVLLDGPREQIVSTDNLQWVLYKQLEELGFKKRFPLISAYYSDHDELKRMALAEKLADLFDQYQIYRPEMIKEWNGYGDFDKNTSNWQHYLWVRTKEVLGAKMPDKTLIGKYIIDALSQKDKQQKLRDNMPHIQLFGISIITAYHLDIFQAAARYIDISFHLLNPAPSQYWFEDRSGKQIALWKKRRRIVDFAPPIEGNTLLTHWGKVIQDTFSLFFRNEDFLNEYRDDGAIEPETHCLLGKIQNEIFHNTASLEERNTLTLSDLRDGSISINACFTPAREVEVLYNYIVRLVDLREDRLSPRDIVVMVSDIDAYSPYIKAIFKSAPYQFPFTIADESIQSGDGLFSALQAIMALQEDRFKAEEVLQLLELSAIRKRFQITDLELIRKVVNAANIRFGIEGDRSDDTATVSWTNGMNRMIYGICMSGEEEYVVDGYSIYPLDRVEGSEALEIIRFCHFIKVLINIVQEQRRERTLVEWSSYITYLVSQLVFYVEDQEDEDYQYLLRYLERLNTLAETVPDKISFQVFKHSFIKNTSTEIRAGDFASGGITFCSLIPMRSIPFKVVAMLGLNFDKFPRKEIAVSFDMMQNHWKRGDRNVKDNDKHLFLETVLSAQEHLYISYIGRNIKNNELQPPSALVDELIDYVIQGVEEEGISRAQWVTEHPLHAFSQRYSMKGDGIYTYLGESITDKKYSIIRKNEKRVQYFDEISINRFSNFFKNPFEEYYRQVLDISYREEDILLSDTECFELDALQLWKWKQEVVVLDEIDLKNLQHKAVKTGTLPLKNMAEIEIQGIEETVAPIREILTQYTQGREVESLVIDLRIEDTQFRGRLDRVYGHRHLFISFSKHQYKYFLAAYIQHLFTRAAGYDIDTVYISGSDQEVYTIDRHFISRQEALDRLKKLLILYKRGWDSPLMYSPLFENDPYKLEKMDAVKFKEELRKKLSGERITIHDPYILKEYESGFFDQEDIFDQYYRNWKEIFLPVIDAFPTMKFNTKK